MESRSTCPDGTHTTLAIVIEYELLSKSFAMFAVQMRCENGITFCVVPLHKYSAENSWTYQTIETQLRVHRMQFNGFPVAVKPQRNADQKTTETGIFSRNLKMYGSEMDLALQPYFALGAKFNFTASPVTTVGYGEFLSCFDSVIFEGALL